jgi:HK97 family phage portal protein
MGLRFTRDRGFSLERKADPQVLSAELQALLDQGPLSYTADGSVDFFHIFGSSYGKLYKTQSALRAVVDFLSRNIAECKIRKFAVGSDGVALPDPDHPVQRILDHPQPGVPRSRFMRQVVGDKAIYDVAAIWKIRETFDPRPNQTTQRITNSGPVRNLLRIPVPYISVFQGSLAAPISFRVMAGRDQVVVPAQDVIWMPGYSPDSNTTGVPPVETLRQILAEEWAAGKRQENRWRRGPQLDVVFLQDKDAPPLDTESSNRFKVDWQNRYGGVTSEHSGEVPLMPPGITPQQIAIDAQSAQYLATRKLAREECCLAYGIQPQLLGVTQSNFGSMDMYHQMLYQDTLTTWTVPIQEEFEEQLLAEFETDLEAHYLDFNINAKLQGSFLEQAKIGQQAVGGPWMTRNEFREKFQGLPPVPGGDEIIVPLNVVLGGGPQANPQDVRNQFNQANHFNAELLPDGVVRLWPRSEGAQQ